MHGLAAGKAGSIWALSESAATLWRVDPVSDAVIAAIPVDVDSTNVVAGAHDVWVAGSGGGLGHIEPDLERRRRHDPRRTANRRDGDARRSAVDRAALIQPPFSELS